MPQFIAAIVAAIGLTGVAASIATAVLSLALSVGLNALMNAVFGKGGTGKPSDGQKQVRVAVGSRVRHYGIVRVGGQLTFYESRNGNIYILTTTGHGRINAIIEYLINGKVVTVDGSGTVTSISYSSGGTHYPVKIHHRLGDPDQTAYSELSAIFSEWTSDHRQRGCSSILVIGEAVKSDFFSDVYDGGREPEGTITAETSLVYDPRLDDTAIIGRDGDGAPIYGTGAHRLADPSTWAFSENWALNFADYLAHVDGYGLGADMINWENIAAEAEICDQTVSTVDARTIARWRVAGSYRLAENERKAVVGEFLKAGDGFMWQDADGLANIRCGRWITPTVHIDEKHIIGCTASFGVSAPDRANEVRVVYMEPRLGYVETEAAPLRNEASIIALGRSEVKRFDAYFCPDHNQAQRIGKRLLNRLSDRWTVTLTTNLAGLNAVGERFITITINELAIVALAFEITSIKIDPEGCTVELGLTQVEETDFTFDPETEEGDPPADAPDTTIPIVIEEMAGLTLDAVQITLGGSVGVGIQAIWDEPSRVGLVAQLQYQATGGTEWLEMTVSQDDRIAKSGLVSTGVEYGVRGRLLTIAGRASAWSATSTITPVADELSVSVPTEFTATGGVGNATIDWRNPNESSFDHVEIYESATNVFGTATQLGADQFGALGELMESIETLAAGTHYIWLVAYTSGGGNSGPTASQTVTVT